MLACTINLLQNLLSSRFTTSVKDDTELLKQEIPMRLRFAIMHRLDCKQILQSNIKTCQILMRILANITQVFQANSEVDKSVFKRLYM